MSHTPQQRQAEKQLKNLDRSHQNKQNATRPPIKPEKLDRKGGKR